MAYRPAWQTNLTKGAAQPRPAGATAAPAADLVVSTQSRTPDVGLKTLLGNYQKKGMNQGKPYFQKAGAVQGVNVFLYYWDQRDGAEFSGWWFGDELGGQQVWARCQQHGPQPPRVGWHIPWDSPTAEPGALIVTAAPAGGSTVPPKPGLGGLGVKLELGGQVGGAAGAAAYQAKSKQLGEAVTKAEATAKDNVALSKKVNQTTSESDIKAAQDKLQASQLELQALAKTLMDSATAARAAGANAEHSSLQTRARASQATVNQEVTRLKGLTARMVQEAEKTAKWAKQESEDAEKFKAELPAAQEKAGLAEDAVEAVALTAQPLINDPPEGELLTSSCGDIEKSAGEAQTTVAESRRVLQQKIAAASRYAPKAKKEALAEYTKLQEKITEAQKKLNPYKKFKETIQNSVAAKKALAAITEKLSMAELEIEKASMTTKGSDKGQMPEDEVTAAEEATKAAQTALAALLRLIQQKTQLMDATVKEDFDELKKRSTEAKQKLDAVSLALRSQRLGLSTAKNQELAKEKLAKADEALKQCHDAELPFLKGIEVLPTGESGSAISNSEAAAKATEVAITQARNFVTQQTNQAKNWPKELKDRLDSDYAGILKRIDELTSKLNIFKKDTMERKINAVTAEVSETLKSAEKAATTFADLAKPFGRADITTIDAEKKASAVAAEKEAITAITAARQVLTQKQQKNKAPDMVKALGELQTRLQTAQSSVNTGKKDIMTGEKTVKSKTVLAEEGANAKKAEELIKGAEQKADMKEELSDGALQQVVQDTDDAMSIAKKSIGLVQRDLALCVPSLKDDLQKLADRFKKVLELVEKVKAETKDQREKVLSSMYVKEAIAKIEALEKIVDRVGEIETPFLKGIEVNQMSLDKAQKIIGESKEALAQLDTSVKEVRNYIAAKNLEMKKFQDKFSKEAIAELTKQTDKINTAAAKLTNFKTETESRERSTQVMDADKKMAELEELAKATDAAVAPFTAEDKKEGDEMTEQCEKLQEAQKSSDAKLQEVRVFFTARQKDAKCKAEHGEALTKLSTRLTEVSQQLAKSRKIGDDHLAGFRKKKLLEEAEQELTKLEPLVQKGTDATDAFVKDKCISFLVDASIKTFTDAVLEQMSEKTIKVEDVYKAAIGKKKKFDEAGFVAYLEKLPAELSNDALAFTPERRIEMFKAAASKDAVTLKEFQSLFQRRYRAVQAVTLTDGLSIKDSKTVAKLEIGEVVLAMGPSKKEEGTANVRMEVRQADGDKVGYVTVSGGDDKPIKYLIPENMFGLASKEMDAKVQEVVKEIQQILAYFKGKIAELNTARQGPLAEAKAELTKLQSKALTALRSIDDLKKKVQEAKKEFNVTLVKEKNAHLIAKDQKQADEILAPVREKVQIVEQDSTKVEESAAAITKLEEAALKTFDKPKTVLDQVKKLHAALQVLVAEVKVGVKDAQAIEAIKTATKPGPLLEARKELGRANATLAQAERKATLSLNNVQNVCGELCSVCQEAVSAAIRAEIAAKASSIDKFFTKLAKGKDLDEKAFVSMASKLEAVKAFPKEHISLVFDSNQVQGINKRRFTSLVQQHFTVIKAIALTNEYEVSKCKTIRRLELDEIVQTVEGPRVDDATGLTRVRARSLIDGTIGWISVKGNQGTPFLQEVEKPFYVCMKDAKMDKEFGGGGTVRELQVEDIFELLEGPRKETIEPSQRAKVKGVADGTIGFITIVDSNGVVHAEQTKNVWQVDSSVAMTDSVDIQSSTVLRKLNEGEFFYSEGEPQEDSGITRLKGKAAKDGIEGWVSLKGNAGTMFLKQQTKHYNVLRDTELHKTFKSTGAESLKMLTKGEVVELIEGPRAEKFDPISRVKGRSIDGEAEGWVTVEKNTVKHWTSSYKCIRAQKLQESAELKDAKEVQDLAPNDLLEYLEGPVTVKEGEGEDAKEVRRIKCRTGEGKVGWATVRGADKKALLVC